MGASCCQITGCSNITGAGWLQITDAGCAQSTAPNCAEEVEALVISIKTAAIKGLNFQLRYRISEHPSRWCVETSSNIFRFYDIQKEFIGKGIHLTWQLERIPFWSRSLALFATSRQRESHLKRHKNVGFPGISRARARTLIRLLSCAPRCWVRARVCKWDSLVRVQSNGWKRPTINLESVFCYWWPILFVSSREKTVDKGSQAFSDVYQAKICW